MDTSYKSLIDEEAYIDLVVTACDLEDFLEGNRARREFIIKNNPHRINQELAREDDKRTS